MNKFLLVVIILGFLISEVYGNTVCSTIESADSIYIRALDYYDESEDSSTVIEITYPKVFGLSNKSVEDKINLFLEEEFLKSVELFEEFVTILDSFPTTDYEAGMFFSFETGFDIKLLNQSILSFALNHYEFTGGAHGNYFSIGYTIDLTSGNLLSLNQIIKTESLPVITSLCEDIIKQMFEAESLFDAGLFEDALELNLDQDFYVVDGALVFQFDPYEIAPYSMGNIEVIIPLDEISEFIILNSLLKE